LNKEIAEQLGCKPSRVTKLLKIWFESRGLQVPNQYERRRRLAARCKPHKYQLLAAQAKALWDDGLLILEIASRLGCNRATARSAVKEWYVSRGLPIPDGRGRRKSLDRKVSHPRRMPTKKSAELENDAQADGRDTGHVDDLDGC